MVKIDETDKNILVFLGRDSRATATQISKDLAEKQISLTPRTVLNRIKKLEECNIIHGYTTILNPSLFAKKETITILLKFVDSPDNADVEKLNSYINGFPFCFCAIRMIGEAEGYDYACHFVFDTEQQFKFQLDLVLNTFGDLIAHYQVYKSKVIKEIPPALISVYDTEEDSTLKSANKQTANDFDDVQSLHSRLMDDVAKSIVSRFGNF